MFTPEFTRQYLKDLKLIRKRGWNEQKLNEIILLLTEDSPLPVKCKNHPLSGNYKGFYECHIMPDWLLIYFEDEINKRIIFVRTGSHSDLF